MTAPRKPVAWMVECANPDGLFASNPIQFITDPEVAAEFSVSTPLYTAPDLKPLWALVEKWMQQASDADEMAAARLALEDEGGCAYWTNFAATKRNMARELQGTLEAMQ